MIVGNIVITTMVVQTGPVELVVQSRKVNSRRLSVHRLGTADKLSVHDSVICYWYFSDTFTGYHHNP